MTTREVWSTGRRRIRSLITAVLPPIEKEVLFAENLRPLLQRVTFSETSSCILGIVTFNRTYFKHSITSR